MSVFTRGYMGLLALVLGSCASAVMAQGAYDSYLLFDLLTNDSDFEHRYVDESERIWRSQIENDALTGSNITDQYYTNALNVRSYVSVDGAFLYENGRLYGYLCGPEALKGSPGSMALGSEELGAEEYAECVEAPRRGVQTRDLKLVTYGFGFGHKMYTPYQHAGRGFRTPAGYQYLENALHYDRPYAAWLYLSRNLTLEDLDSYSEYEVSIGMVGPAAAGRWVQESAHSYPFTGAMPIQGWRSQVHNRLAIQYSGKLAWHLLQQPMLAGRVKVSHFARLELGTVIDRLGYGVELSAKWPESASCDVYRASEVMFVDTLALPDLTVEQRVWRFREDLQHYLSAAAYIPDVQRNKLLAVEEGIDAFLAADASATDGFRFLQRLQHEVAALNDELRNLALRSCHPGGMYAEVFGNATGHYVVYNYLIDNGIHIPANADPAAAGIMKTGGTRHVHRNPWIASATIGVKTGWKDSWGIGLNYHFRSEETREQHDQHAWAELVLEGKSDWAALFIPGLLLAASLNNRENWPD